MARLHIVLDPTRTGREAQRLQADLQSLVVGQEEAVRAIVDAYQTYSMGMSIPGRPIASFLFLGPTGAGKTKAVEATAQCLFGKPTALTKVDCAEFQHSHEIAKLIGSPPGYLGHRETHPALSQEVIDQYHTDNLKVSLVLFDEIEKASDALWNLLLGILDKGILTLGDNRKVDFSRALIFMTSNLGATEMSALLHPRFGFSVGQGTLQANGSPTGPSATARLSRSSVDAARKKFSPEFLNRLDKIVVFRALDADQLYRILELELNLVQERLLSTEYGFFLSLTDAAKNHLLHEGTDVRYGARQLIRAIQTLLVHPISNLTASGQVGRGDLVTVDMEPRLCRLIFVKEGEHFAAHGAVARADGRAVRLAPKSSVARGEAVTPGPPPKYAS